MPSSRPGSTVNCSSCSLRHLCVAFRTFHAVTTIQVIFLMCLRLACFLHLASCSSSHVAHASLMCAQCMFLVSLAPCFLTCLRLVCFLHLASCSFCQAAHNTLVCANQKFRIMCLTIYTACCSCHVHHVVSKRLCIICSHASCVPLKQPTTACCVHLRDPEAVGAPVQPVGHVQRVHASPA